MIMSQDNNSNTNNNNNNVVGAGGVGGDDINMVSNNDLDQDKPMLDINNNHNNQNNNSTTPIPTTSTTSNHNNNNQSPPTQFTCTITNFSQKDAPFYTANESLWGLTWRVYIFPKGNVSQDDLSLFLDLVEIRQPNFPCQKANFVLEIINQVNPEHSIKKISDHIFTPKSSDWGFNKFMKLADLNNPNSGFIKDDTLLLSVHIYNVVSESNTQRGLFIYNSKKLTGFVGLKNQGATCYMNSLLQALYQISPFRKAVYELPTTSSSTSTNNNNQSNNTNNTNNTNNQTNGGGQQDQNEITIPLALQRLFYKMQCGSNTVSTKELTKSFGWGTHDIFTQHDVQELNRVLCDNLNEKMKGTKAEGIIDQLFRGKIKNFIKCTKVKYESTREEFFYDLSLNVKGCSNILASFEKYTEIERLDGSNQYDAEGYGLQDANKGLAFLSFPPVLHLQLKRFEYDPLRDANVKVNDKYTFPEKLDLTRFLDEDADKTIPSVYRLQGVLIHSGDIHNGHYYAFLRPNKNGDWLKFDDEEVSKCPYSYVTEESFGTEVEGQLSRYTNIRNYTNAYMLIYLREKEMDDLLCPIPDNEIPVHLKERIVNEEMRTSNQFYRLKITTEEDFANSQNAFDLVDFSKISFQSIPLKTTENMNISYLKKQLLTIYGIPPERQRLWVWSTRKNKSYRIDPRPESDETSLRELSEKYPKSDIRIHLEISYIPRPLNMNEYFQPIGVTKDKEYALVFFKYYDPQEKSLRFVGSKVIDVNSRVSLLLPLLCQLARLPMNQPLLLFEEVSEQVIDPIKPNEPFKKLEIGNGDIIVFQKQISINENYLYPTAIQYFGYIRHRIVVDFKQVENNSICADNSFSLELSKEMKYSQITKAIAQHIRVDSDKIRLMTTPRFLGPDHYNPIKPNDNIPLSDILNSTLHNSNYSIYNNMNNNNSNMKQDQLFFEVLSIPVSECENNRNFRITWKNPLTGVHEKVSIWVKKDGIIADLKRIFVNTIEKQISQQLEKQSQSDRDKAAAIFTSKALDINRIKLLEIRHHKIDKELYNETTLGYIMDSNTLKMELMIGEDALPKGPNETLVQVVHFNNDSGMISYNGNPFLFIVRVGDTTLQLRQRLFNSYLSNEVSQNEFQRWKLALISNDKQVEFLQEDASIKEGDWSFSTLGLHHPSLPLQKAIKINK